MPTKAKQLKVKRKREMQIKRTNIVMILHRREREMMMQRCRHLNLSVVPGERGQSHGGQKR
jgi:hypothetical protein